MNPLLAGVGVVFAPVLVVVAFWVIRDVRETRRERRRSRRRAEARVRQLGAVPSRSRYSNYTEGQAD